MPSMTKYVAIASALAVPLLAAAPASASSGPVSSAYGISASGVVNFPATPSVTSTTQPHQKTLTKFPHNPIITTFSLAAAKATSNHSMAGINYLGILTPKVPLPAGTPKLPNGLVFAKVAAARCDNGTGSSKIVKLAIAGKAINAGTSPNTTVTVAILNIGKVTATINKQVRHSDGTLTVTAIELDIALGGKAETVDISSATCGRAITSQPSPTTTAPTPAPVGEAPKPTPVKSDLPVTG